MSARKDTGRLALTGEIARLETNMTPPIPAGTTVLFRDKAYRIAPRYGPTRDRSGQYMLLPKGEPTYGNGEANAIFARGHEFRVEGAR